MGLMGGKYKPLTDHDGEQIHQTALDVLENIGMGDPIPEFEAALKMVVQLMIRVEFFPKIISRGCNNKGRQRYCQIRKRSSMISISQIKFIYMEEVKRLQCWISVQITIDHPPLTMFMILPVWLTA